MRSKRYLLLIARKKRRRVSSQVIVAKFLIPESQAEKKEKSEDAGSIRMKCLGDGLFCGRKG